MTVSDGHWYRLDELYERVLDVARAQDMAFVEAGEREVLELLGPADVSGYKNGASPR